VELACSQGLFRFESSSSAASNRSRSGTTPKDTTMVNEIGDPNTGDQSTGRSAFWKPFAIGTVALLSLGGAVVAAGAAGAQSSGETPPIVEKELSADQEAALDAAFESCKPILDDLSKSFHEDCDEGKEDDADEDVENEDAKEDVDA